MTVIEFNFKRSVKSVHQNEAMECGLACLAMIANYHRHKIDLPYLRSLFPPTKHGMTLAEIVDVAEQLKLDAQGLAVTSIAELPNVKCPALLHWNDNHFVVLEKVVRGKFHIHDPAFGLRIYAAEDMERHFSGVAMEFEPRVDFEAVRIAKKSLFWSVLRSCRGLEHTVAIVTSISLAANLFALATPILLEVALDTVLPQFDLDLLTTVSVGLLLFMLFDASARWIRDAVTLRAATTFEIFFTRNVVGHAFRLPLRYFEARHPGDFVTRITSIDQIKNFLVGGFVSAIADGSLSFLIVGLMYYYSPTMTFISVATIALAIISRLATYPRIAATMSASLESRSEEQARLLDGLRRVDALKVHNATVFFDLKWFESFVSYANLSFRTKKLTIDTDFMLHGLFAFGTVATIYIGVTDVMKNVASVGVLYAFFALRMAFFNNMNALIMNLLQLSIMKVHFQRLEDVLGEEPEQTSSKGVRDRIIRRGVTLENITLQFGRNARPLLQNVDLKIDVGHCEAIAIIGESGSGKSSLLKVISSLHQPAGGRLLVDGQPLDIFGLHEYRANLGAVFADDGLFAGTVAENLAMFVPDITRATMESTLRAVGLLDEIYALPQGLATPLSNESAVLSTGQRRRLIVARALCRNPRLLLLDEVTANLDPQSEMELVRSLMQIPTAKIFVTHSANLLSSVDRILRVGDAEVREVPRKSRSAKSPELVLA